MLKLLSQHTVVKQTMPVMKGVVRIDLKTKDLVKRIKPGEIALVNHRDMDSLAARALIDAGVIAVINAASFSTGRYPNTGPTLLYEAGIPLWEEAGNELFTRLKDGDTLTIRLEQVWLDGDLLPGQLLSTERIRENFLQGQKNIGKELNLFAQNTLERLSSEWSHFFEPLNLPTLKTVLRGKQAVVVTRGPDYERDLNVPAFREYIKKVNPIIIAVDGAADKLLETGMKPHLLVGDMDSVSDNAIKSGAEIIVHGYLDLSRGAPGWKRCEKLNVDAHLVRAPGTSEDLAMLIADELGAELIVAVGTHFSMEEFLDKGRAGMSSTFLTRLKTGSKLIDAKGLRRILDTQSSALDRSLDYFWLIGAALVTVLTAAAFSPLGQTVINTIRTWLRLHGR